MLALASGRVAWPLLPCHTIRGCHEHIIPGFLWRLSSSEIVCFEQNPTRARKTYTLWDTQQQSFKWNITWQNPLPLQVVNVRWKGVVLRERLRTYWLQTYANLHNKLRIDAASKCTSRPRGARVTLLDIGRARQDVVGQVGEVSK